MVTNSIGTLLFLAAVLTVYYAVPPRKRWTILLAASLFFYMSANPWMVLLITGSGVWSWYAGRKIEESAQKKGKRGWLLACILPLLGVLFFFKYLNFFISSVAQLLSVMGLKTEPAVLKLLLPLGISYYTFKILSYCIDIYQGKRASEPELGCYLTYVLFFPQILSGPIERSESFLPQMKQGPVFDPELFAQGLQLIILGLFKKMVIANRLSGYVDTIFSSPDSYPALAAVMAAVFFSFQIYCDFSGYSDMAVGMAATLGIRCKENFNCPYFSRSIREFWSRWHISLSGWLRDYIYIPLGGSRVSRARRNGNLMVTFLVSGLWHGDNWTYIVWGGIHGFWNMAGRKKGEHREGRLRMLLQTVWVFLGVTCTWVFFRAESLGAALGFFRRMVTGFSLSLGDIQNAVLPFTGDNTCAAYFLTVCLLLLLLAVYEWQRVYGKKREEVLSVPWLIGMLLLVLLFGVFGSSSFLYAQF